MLCAREMRGSSSSEGGDLPGVQGGETGLVFKGLQQADQD
jgi:hypothetical protein